SRVAYTPPEGGPAGTRVVSNTILTPAIPLLRDPGAGDTRICFGRRRLPGGSKGARGGSPAGAKVSRRDGVAARSNNLASPTSADSIHGRDACRSWSSGKLVEARGARLLRSC